MPKLPDRPASKHLELARFLKAMRDRTSPAAVGLSVSSRRRAPGLLREEVAQASGISATWYTWMEQARPTNPSQRVLDGLAQGLHLDPAERAHLFRLARPDLQPLAPTSPSANLGEALTAVLTGLAPHPAYAMNALWDVIAWNEPAALLLGGFKKGDPLGGNVLVRLCLDPAWRRLFVDWDNLVRSAVEQFRGLTARISTDPDFVSFVQKLERASPEFSRLWNRQGVRTPTVWCKTLDHPKAGRLSFNSATMRPDGVAEDLRFSLYTPADSETKRRFAALLALKS